MTVETKRFLTFQQRFHSRYSREMVCVTEAGYTQMHRLNYLQTIYLQTQTNTQKSSKFQIKVLAIVVHLERIIWENIKIIQRFVLVCTLGVMTMKFSMHTLHCLQLHSGIVSNMIQTCDNICFGCPTIIPCVIVDELEQFCQYLTFLHSKKIKKKIHIFTAYC